MTNECWLWAGTINHLGYGHVARDGKTEMAHRIVYEHEVGLIPDGLTLDHLCKVRHCVNPRHMEVVTLKENILRGTSPSATNAKKTHCVNGHEFNEENTGWHRTRNNQPARYCKTCRHKHVNAWYARKQMAI